MSDIHSLAVCFEQKGKTPPARSTTATNSLILSEMLSSRWDLIDQWRPKPKA
ncbi:hypothetical protein MTR_2g099460 [Medicago truncatula]|uniref:Uncharacterized protein n=1 Tax=Medicago truncatula TaxID=3880 RepID=G7IS18_MEDTR|nr:hypothetical protein MTR_2g099460 [Medicago truncatula]